MDDADDRAARAAEAWRLARARGDDRLRVAALADYRAARREARRERYSDREARALSKAFRVEFCSSWATESIADRP